MSSNTPNLAAFRGWKWIVGLVYIVLAVVLYIIGRVGLFEFAVLLGIGIILV